MKNLLFIALLFSALSLSALNTFDKTEKNVDEIDLAIVDDVSTCQDVIVFSQLISQSQTTTLNEAKTLQLDQAALKSVDNDLLKTNYYNISSFHNQPHLLSFTPDNPENMIRCK